MATEKCSVKLLVEEIENLLDEALTLSVKDIEDLLDEDLKLSVKDIENLLDEALKLSVKEIENLLDEAFSGKLEVFCRDCNELIPFDWDNTYCYTCLLAKKDVSSNSEENRGLLDVYKCNEKGKLPNWYLGY